MRLMTVSRRCAISCSLGCFSWTFAMIPKPIYLCLNQPQLAAIGEVIAHWAFFETEVAFTLTTLVSVFEGHQKIPLPFKDRMELWRKLVRSVFKEEAVVNEYLGIERIAQSMHLARSIFAHGRILGDPKKNTDAICIENHRHRQGKWTVQRGLLTVRRLRKIARMIRSLSSHLISLNEAHLPVSLKSLPCTFPSRRDAAGSRYRQGHIHKSTRYILPGSFQA
jgi:hypothetical protein